MVLSAGFLQRLIVCLEESIYIHNIKDMKLLKTILDTPANATGKPMSLDQRGKKQLARHAADSSRDQSLTASS